MSEEEKTSADIKVTHASGEIDMSTFSILANLCSDPMTVIFGQGRIAMKQVYWESGASGLAFYVTNKEIKPRSNVDFKNDLERDEPFLLFRFENIQSLHIVLSALAQVGISYFSEGEEGEEESEESEKAVEEEGEESEEEVEEGEKSEEAAEEEGEKSEEAVEEEDKEQWSVKMHAWKVEKKEAEADEEDDSGGEEAHEEDSSDSEEGSEQEETS